MGNFIRGGDCFEQNEEEKALTDAGVEKDADGNITDPKELLKIGLV